MIVFADLELAIWVMPSTCLFMTSKSIAGFPSFSMAEAMSSICSASALAFALDRGLPCGLVLPGLCSWLYFDHVLSFASPLALPLSLSLPASFSLQSAE